MHDCLGMREMFNAFIVYSVRAGVQQAFRAQQNCLFEQLTAHPSSWF